ncbi:hypothetical protein Drose_01545 [Dactylosporangium roseum]|uniref:WYL domain-containing protein n=1 Tax=Dactylosporangium roseum TaxID=47989 RepID=A0ABY5Z5B8_9ACTN|nr:hypothetical protein [Dactylosporangium roseum]UWZ37037.1 hypothetical protein Drose_01545 [Dactylosporangium roseum]
MFDKLLLWCSERGEGSMRAFRETYEWLAGRAASAQLSWAVALTNLQHLGHVEVDWEQQHWAVAPPTLTTMSNSGGLALLVGAQPRYLLQRLDSLECDPDARVVALSASVLFHPRVPQPNGPSARYVAVEDEAAAQCLCELLGIHHGAWAADRLVAMLPSLPQMLRARPSLRGPAGIEPRRLVVSETSGQLEWRPCTDDSRSGAYEYQRYGVPRYVYRVGGVGFVADKRTVVYAELARIRRQVLHFNPGRRELLVPARHQLPLPQGRCAVLKSGLLPVPVEVASTAGWRGLARYVRYANIDEPFARAVAASLEQPLQLMPQGDSSVRFVAAGRPRAAR